MADLSLDLSRVALKRRRTKIVATVGPASSSKDMAARLLNAGVDVFRMNFSHGTHEQHALAYANLREAAKELGMHVAILADLCGPKIRVGMFENGAIELETGSEVTVTVRDVVGKPGLIPSQYTALARDVYEGARILLDDGKLELRVKSVSGDDIQCLVINGGKLSNKKGMNLPGVNVSAAALTDKDRKDAAFAAGLGVDYIALSFVRAREDVDELRALLADIKSSTPIIAKIEKPEALTQIGPILRAADGIMVARGDLGVECPAEEVPLIQQELVRLSITANKPVIVATQMLESMIENSRPTRAEVSDVANAALSRADAVMLSAETASGKFPVEAVATMDRVLRMVEGYQFKHGMHGVPTNHVPADGHSGEALSRATSLLSGELGVRAVVVPTRSGNTARLVSAERPAAPVVVMTSDERISRRMALLWGVTPELVGAKELEDAAKLSRSVITRLGLAEPKQAYLLVWEASTDPERSMPTVSILTL